MSASSPSRRTARARHWPAADAGGRTLALDRGKPALELQTRIELTGNHAVFARLGFHETERTAHAGYARPTSITMRKALS